MAGELRNCTSCKGTGVVEQDVIDTKRGPGRMAEDISTNTPPAPYGDHGYVAALDRSGTCRSCGKEGWIDRAPGRFPRCGNCGVIQLHMGKFYDAPCVTPNGRTDGHGSYVTHNGKVVDGMHMSACAFCGRDLDEPLPEWPELEEEDLEFEACALREDIMQYVQRQGGVLEIGVRIVHKPSGLRASCATETSLLKNKAKALGRLREQLKRVGRGAYNIEE